MRWYSVILCILVFSGLVYCGDDSIELVESDGFTCEMNVENAHPVVLLANGGAHTTPESPIGQNVSSLTLINNVKQTKENILAFVEALKSEQTPTHGYPCIITQNNPDLIEKINQDLESEYQLKAIASLGYNQTLFVVDSYAQDHRENIEGILEAIFNTANSFRANVGRLGRASILTAEFYQDDDVKYWETYFLIQQKNDLFVHNLEDNLFSMGLAPNSENTLSRIYTEDIIDNSYVKYLIMNRTKSQQSASASSYLIHFDLGKVDLKPEDQKFLREILGKINTNTLINIIGHTDNSGGDKINLRISEERAQVVRDWLLKESPDIKTIKVTAIGSREPIATNDTEEGRAKNRRVQIILQN